jgi:hypothetical protein
MPEGGLQWPFFCPEKPELTTLYVDSNDFVMYDLSSVTQSGYSFMSQFESSLFVILYTKLISGTPSEIYWDRKLNQKLREQCRNLLAESYPNMDGFVDLNFSNDYLVRNGVSTGVNTVTLKARGVVFTEKTKNDTKNITEMQDSAVAAYQNDNDLDDFIITTNSVGPYVIGNSFPEVDGIESIRKEETRWGEEASQYEVVYYDILLGKEKLMEVHVNSYSKITGISILSPRIRTSNGIRVGSTIEEFAAAFSDYRILYNYVTDWYWIESRNEGGGIKYRLDEKNLLNPRIDAVITEFKKSDWSRDSEIKIIECGSRQLN